MTSITLITKTPHLLSVPIDHGCTILKHIFRLHSAFDTHSNVNNCRQAGHVSRGRSLRGKADKSKSSVGTACFTYHTPTTRLRLCSAYFNSTDGRCHSYGTLFIIFISKGLHPLLEYVVPNGTLS